MTLQATLGAYKANKEQAFQKSFAAKRKALLEVCSQLVNNQGFASGEVMFTLEESDEEEGEPSFAQPMNYAQLAGDQDAVTYDQDQNCVLTWIILPAIFADPVPFGIDANGKFFSPVSNLTMPCDDYSAVVEGTFKQLLDDQYKT